VRFREYRYGIAAIVALAHDVSIVLGVVALMHFSGIVDVEIDLAMIAAFLTIIGYSLNDTIVLFDRVRENLPRMTDKSFKEVLDISINQTLSRTLLTSLTTLLALVIIFVFNYGRQNVLEGFSFAMILGVLVGTYSSIFVASPVLTMIHKKHGAHPTAASQVPATKSGSKKKGGKGQPGGVPA
jgi:preprotein translocase SecF subunit